MLIHSLYPLLFNRYIFYMKKFILLQFTLSFYLLCAAFASAQDWQVGIAEYKMEDSQRHRKITTHIYYPTDTQALSIVGENKVFKGIPATIDAQMATGLFSLIILSHGSGGNSYSMDWLAHALVKSGMIVVAPNHPGSTTGDSQQTESIKTWLQVEDISFVLDQMLQLPQFKDHINIQNIGVIGHSKGAYSAIAAIGGRLSKPHFIDYCKNNASQPNCSWYLAAGTDLTTIDQNQFEKNYHDTRIRFAVALDPGFSSAFQKESIRTLETPLFLVAADYYIPEQPQLNLNVNLIGKLLDSKIHTFKTIKKSGHFDFLPICQSDAKEILAEEGEAFICDESHKTRAFIHQQVIQLINAFIQQQSIK